MEMNANDCHDPPKYWTIHGLWKHEWDKHGTCAATVEVLNSQRKYFGKALELYQHIDLNGYMTAIKEALIRFYGVTPKIQCLPPEEGEEAQTIGQIEICFTKQLQLVNCTVLEGESNPVQAHLELGTSELSSICGAILSQWGRPGGSVNLI
ncbi:hypothetical protein IHE44_0009180 [Lamprotornis superbus]|uniref:Uncharacterized protein n=1 Tax=Lamprotornis superbus TaxID=245042 RepID=A0A835TXU6_9PASS|nr:hypothetical protein IHE44_0009180 [Lamprotornis superbus]